MTSTTLFVLTGLGAGLVASTELPDRSDRGRGDVPASTVSAPAEPPAAVDAGRGPAERELAREPGSVDVQGFATCILCWL